MGRERLTPTVEIVIPVKWIAVLLANAMLLAPSEECVL